MGPESGDFYQSFLLSRSIPEGKSARARQAESEPVVRRSPGVRRLQMSIGTDTHRYGSLLYYGANARCRRPGWVADPPKMLAVDNLG